MPPTRSEYLTYQESIGRTHIPSLDTAMGVLKTAAVSFEHLTNDPHWDRFLSKLQALLQDAKLEEEGWAYKCCVLTNDEQVRNAQNQYHAAHARVVLLEHIMGLPQEVRELYNKSQTEFKQESA